MKIAVIGCKGLPAGQGGIEHHCKELYSRIVQLGHSVDLYSRCSYTKSKPFDSYYSDGIKIIPVPSLDYRGFDALFNSAFSSVAAGRDQYEIVHFHGIGPSFFCWVPKILSSAKIIVTCHGLDWARSKWGKSSSFFLRKGEENAVIFANQLITVSQELKTYFQETYSVNPVYIPNAPANYPASDTNFSFGKSLQIHEGRYILYVGRLVPEKRPDILLQAFQSLNLKGWKLVFVGDQSDTSLFKSELIDLAASNPNILFTGTLMGARLAEIVRSAGIFVLPSEVEGFPLVLLEAMNQGVPVIASDIPVHKSLLAGKYGLLFKTNSLDDCSQRLNWAVQNLAEMQQMAHHAKHYVQTQFNWDRIAQETLEVYER